MLSKRKHSAKLHGNPLFIGLVCLGLSLFLASTAEADPNGGIEISLNSFDEADLGSEKMLRIQYNSDLIDQEFGGFNLLIQFDTAIAMPVYVQRGGLLYIGEWEYFDYAIDSNGSVRIIAVADIPNGDQHPLGLLGIQEGELAYVIFQINDDSSQINQYFDINFLWEDCGDNTFSSPSGDTLFLSREVYLWDSQEPFMGGESLPTYEGAPDSCLSSGGNPDSKIRLADYYGSYINIYEPRYMRGDINVNDIAYEISDYQNFIAYFLFGIKVFSIHPAVQVANSDVNANDIPLELTDVVYLFKVIVGDTLPYPDKTLDLDQDTAVLVQSKQNNTIALNYSDSLAVIVFWFDAYTQIEEYYQSGIWIDFCDYTDSIVFVLYSSAQQKKVGQGPIFRYSGEGELTRAMACSYDDIAMVPIEVKVIQGGDIICGDVSGDSLVNINDAVWIIDYIFGGGFWTVPCPLESSDVNCDGVVNVSDAVFLINYIFVGGKTPCDVDGDGTPDC